MANEQTGPSLVIRQVCDSIIDSLGAKSLVSCLRNPITAF